MSCHTHLAFLMSDLIFTFLCIFLNLLLLCFFLNDSTKEAEIHYRVKALSSTSEGEDVALVTCFVTLALKLSMKPTKWFPIDGFHRGYFIFLLKAGVGHGCFTQSHQSPT